MATSCLAKSCNAHEFVRVTNHTMAVVQGGEAKSMPEMTSGFWFIEGITPSLNIQFQLKSITFDAQSEFQRVQVVETAREVGSDPAPARKVVAGNVVVRHHCAEAAIGQLQHKEEAVAVSG